MRDWLLGLEAKDFDVEVGEVTFEQLHAALAPFGATDVVGRSFGVIKLRRNGVEYDFSLPRRESKTGAGHRGFTVRPEPQLSETDAAARRDFTINAIAFDPFSGAVIDPFNGQHDLEAGILRHTSEAFTDDPLRVLRGFQLAARFDLTLAPETATLCRSIADTYAELPVERVWGEWEKWAGKAVKPSRGLAVLEQTGWLRHFPEIAALRGTPQDPEWHPEGDVFTHTQHCLDALPALPEWRNASAVRKSRLMLAVLAHDFGKPATTSHAERRGQLRWISPGHEAAGGPLTETFLQRIGAPHHFATEIVPLVINHLALLHTPGELTDTSLRRLSRRLQPATIDDLVVVMRADHDGRPPLHSPETLARIALILARARLLEVGQHGPRPLILGRHLIALGYKPDVRFTAIIAAAYEAQLDGVFQNEPAGVIWLENYLRNQVTDLT